MVQSSDLVRISTVQSMDFLGQSSDLVEDLFKSLSDLNLRSSFSLSGCQFDRGNRDCLLHNLCSSNRLRFADGVSELISEHRSECRSKAKILFPSKSLDKSSDCADFTKSMDLSDYLRTFNFTFLNLHL